MAEIWGLANTAGVLRGQRNPSILQPQKGFGCANRHFGYPNSWLIWLVYTGKAQAKMDENNGYPHFRRQTMVESNMQR